MITEILLTAIAVILFINLIFRIFKFKSKWEEIKHAHSKTENISLDENDFANCDISHCFDRIDKFEKSMNDLRDDYLAHKVFTTKSLSELSESFTSYKMKTYKVHNPVPKENKKIENDFKGLKIRKMFTDFTIHKEIKYKLDKKGESEFLGISTIKDVANLKNTDESLYIKEYKKAYQRLWQRFNYKRKKKKNE